MMVVGQTGLLMLQIHGSTWWLVLIAEAPLRLASNSAWAAVLVSLMRPKYPIAAFGAFALMTPVPSLILTGLGKAGFVHVCQFAALLLWFAVFCPKAGSPLLGFVTGIVFSMLIVAFVGCAANIGAIHSALPPVLRGTVVPAATVVFEVLSAMLICLGWRRFYIRGVPLQLFSGFAALTVQSAEGMRLVSFLSASLHQEKSDALRELAVGIGLSVCSDILNRSLIVKKLLLDKVGIDHQVTPEYDAFLRARFTYGYTSFVHAATTALVLALHGAEWAVQPMFWASMAAGLAQEALTDTAFVLLHWWTARTVESPMQTLRRLLAPEGHRVLFLSDTSRVRGFEAEDDTEGAGAAAAKVLEVCGFSLPVGVPAQLLIANMARRTTVSALRGNFGSCTDWCSAQLCLAGQRG